MRFSHSFLFFSISYFFPSTISAHAAHQAAVQPGAANPALGPRADAVSTIFRPGWTSTVTAFTFFTPSPGADPIPITSQSQAVTSYVPILTICPLPPSTPTINTTLPATPPPAPYSNISAPSIPTSYLSSCSISYTPTPTLICHTTLSPLASPAIPITDCTQQITFSTDHGYTLTPNATNAPEIVDLTTYYAALWAFLTAGIPTQGIRKEICSTAPSSSADCETTWEAWETSTGWVPEISTVTVDAVSVTGPALVILHSALPAMTVPVSQVSQISVSTEFAAETGRAVVGVGRVGGGVGVGGGGDGGSGGSGEGMGSKESTTTTTHTQLVTRVVTVQRAGGTGV